MKILVTGGAGFIGSHVVDHYLEFGHQVVVVDDLSTGRVSNINPKASFYQMDIRSPQIEDVFKREQPEIVNHHAAQMDVRRSVEEPLFDADVNVLGSINLIECSRRHGVKRFVYISSGGAAYGEPIKLPCDETHPVDPICPYGASKHTVEHYLFMYHQLYKLEYVVLRYPNVYGPRQDPHGEAGVVAIFTGQMLSGDKVVINGDGEQERDFVYVSDCARANVLALSNNVPSGIYNLGAGEGTTVNEIFSTLKDITKYPHRAVHGPAKLGETRRIYLSALKAKEEMKWIPIISLRDGLRSTVQYFSEAEKSLSAPISVRPVEHEALPHRLHDSNQLKLLHKIRGELENSDNLSSALKRVLQIVLEAVQATSGSILLIDQKHRLLIGELMYGGVLRTKPHGMAYDVLDKGLAGWVTRNRQAVLVSSTREDQRWLRRSWEENEGISRSAISVPLMANGHILGVLTAVHAKANGFDENDFAMVSTVAGLFALSFRNQLLSGIDTSKALEDTEIQSEQRI